MSNERKPLLSDEEIIDEQEAWNGPIDGGIVAKMSETYTARWVRDFYERLITEGKLRVVQEVELNYADGCSTCLCNCGWIQLMEDEFNCCPGCGNKIKRP